jgi:nucleoid-associated protein EbfC
MITGRISRFQTISGGSPPSLCEGGWGDLGFAVFPVSELRGAQFGNWLSVTLVQFIRGNMFKGMGDMFKQAAAMKSKMAEMQEELSKKQVEASTGGGMVKVTANGNNEILHVHIDEELINMKDRAILEDLVAGAMNEVHRKVKDLAQEEMTKLTGGIKIPGLFP